MPNYPVLDADGSVIIRDDAGDVPYDNSADYPVQNGEDGLLVQTPGQPYPYVQPDAGTPDVPSLVDIFSYAQSGDVSGAAMYAGTAGLKVDNGLQRMSNNATSIAFWVRGTEARLNNDGASDSNSSGPLRVTVDDGPETYFDRDANNDCVLFTGLTDDWHFVSVRPGGAYGDNVYITDLANVLTGSGSNFQHVIATTTYNTGDGSAIAQSSHQEAHGRFSGYTQTTWNSSRGGFLSGTASLGFTGTFAGFSIWAKGNYVFVSVDGGVPQVISKPYDAAAFFQPADGLSHDYVVWSQGDAVGLPGVGDDTLSVSFYGGEDITGSDFPRLHVFGHSIVQGISCTSAGHVGYHATAARNGYVPGIFGWSGATIANGLTAVTGTLPGLDVSPSDVAIIDFGQNDIPDFEQGEQDDYNAIIDLLLAKGYGTVICSSIMPGGGAFPTFNNTLEALVSARPEPNVIYLNRAAYTGPPITYGIGVHPDDAGEVAIDELNKTYLDPLL